MKTKPDHEHGLNGRAHLNGTRAVEEPTVSIVIPTRNEIANIEALLTRLAKVSPAGAEVIFVDDSDDTTAYRVRQLAKADGYAGPEIRLLHRPVSMRSGGLGTAVTEGLRMARARWVCVLDADLQHPPEMVSRMVEQGERTDSDLVVATRYGTESSNEGLSGTRRLMSRACALAAKSLLSNRLRGVSDPLSGFFLVRRNAIDVDRLHPNGFKILLEIIGRHPDLRTTEVGYSFSERYAGLSKASVTEARRYAAQLLSLSLSQHGGEQNNKILARAKPALYDVHGIITVSSAYRLPELEKFRVQQLSAPAQIVVRALDHAAGGFVDLDHTVPLIRYQEQLGRAGFIVEVELGEVTTASVSTLVAKSPHVLYTNVVEPILREFRVSVKYDFTVSEGLAV